MSNLDFLGAQVAEANARGDQLRPALEATQADLTVGQAELTRVQAEMHQVQFQLGQQKILCQVKERESLTRWDFAVAHLGYDDIPPIKCVLGQLVFYRSKIGDKFAPNAAPGLFAGWRLEPGCSYKCVGLVLDLAKLKNRSGAWTDPLPVPEQEIYAKDDVPGCPLKDASETALSRLGFDEVVMPDPLHLPFSTADVVRKKARRVYITYCENDRSNHSAECIARFEAVYGGDKGAPPTPALHHIPPTPSLPPPITEDRSGRFEGGAHLDCVEEVQADSGLPSAGSRDPQPHAVEEADDIPSMAELFAPDDEKILTCCSCTRASTSASWSSHPVRVCLRS